MWSNGPKPKTQASKQQVDGVDDIWLWEVPRKRRTTATRRPRQGLDCMAIEQFIGGTQSHKRAVSKTPQTSSEPDDELDVAEALWILSNTANSAPHQFPGARPLLAPKRQRSPDLYAEEEYAGEFDDELQEPDGALQHYSPPSPDGSRDRQHGMGAGPRRAKSRRQGDASVTQGHTNGAYPNNGKHLNGRPAVQPSSNQRGGQNGRPGQQVVKYELDGRPGALSSTKREPLLPGAADPQVGGGGQHGAVPGSNGRLDHASVIRTNASKPESGKAGSSDMGCGSPGASAAAVKPSKPEPLQAGGGRGAAPNGAVASAAPPARPQSSQPTAAGMASAPPTSTSNGAPLLPAVMDLSKLPPGLPQINELFAAAASGQWGPMPGAGLMPGAQWPSVSAALAAAEMMKSLAAEASKAAGGANGVGGPGPMPYKPMAGLPLHLQGAEALLASMAAVGAAQQQAAAAAAASSAAQQVLALAGPLPGAMAACQPASGSGWLNGRSGGRPPFKRCMMHVYIAHMIMRQQQQQGMRAGTSGRQGSASAGSGSQATQDDGDEAMARQDSLPSTSQGQGHPSAPAASRPQAHKAQDQDQAEPRPAALRQQQAPASLSHPAAQTAGLLAAGAPGQCVPTYLPPALLLAASNAAAAAGVHPQGAGPSALALQRPPAGLQAGPPSHTGASPGQQAQALLPFPPMLFSTVNGGPPPAFGLPFPAGALLGHMGHYAGAPPPPGAFGGSAVNGLPPGAAPTLGLGPQLGPAFFPGLGPPPYTTVGVATPSGMLPQHLAQHPQLQLPMSAAGQGPEHGGQMQMAVQGRLVPEDLLRQMHAAMAMKALPEGLANGYLGSPAAAAAAYHGHGLGR